MTQKEPTAESNKTNLPQIKENITKELFVQLTGVEPLSEQETHTQLKTTMKQGAEEMLAPWEKLGLVSQHEMASISQTWENAVILDDTGMEQFGQFHSRVFQKAANGLSAMDKAVTTRKYKT